MWKIKRVPAEEFAEHVAEYLAGHEPVSIEKDGEVIGRYIPEPNGSTDNGAAFTPQHRKGSPEARENRKELDRLLQEIYAQAGLTEEEFVAEFLSDEPTPDDGDSRS